MTLVNIYKYIYTLRKTMKPDYKFISILLRIFEISKNTKKVTGLLQIILDKKN